MSVAFRPGIGLLLLLSVTSLSRAQERAQENVACNDLRKPGQVNFDIAQIQNSLKTTAFPENAVVGDVLITRLPIFNGNDPAETNMLFQVADQVHIDTREFVVRQKLLFTSGESFDVRLLEESERMLREEEYLYDARIWPYRICGEVVDVEVVTREVWTISGGVSLSRSGGNNKNRVSLRDENFLGRGKTIGIASERNRDRSGVEFIYFDPSLFGTRQTLSVLFEDNDDGGEKQFDLERPFFSLDTRNAWQLSYSDSERVDDIFARGEEVFSFAADIETTQASIGYSPGQSRGRTKRWRFGVFDQRERFSAVPNEAVPNEVEELPADLPTQVGLLPADRDIRYPFIGYSSRQEQFIKTTNLNQIARLEDFNLGSSWFWRLGLASENIGNDEDRIAYSLGTRRAWQLDNGALMQWDFELSGLWQYNNNHSEDLIASTRWRYNYNDTGISSYYFAFNANYIRNLGANQQLLLGSDEGLRGYPDRFQNGDRSFVFTAERRYFSDWHIFRLLRVGGAVFFDAGRAFFPGDNDSDATGVLANAGVGLRLASSRAQTNQVVNIDLAVPFEREDDIDTVQLIITAKQSF